MGDESYMSLALSLARRRKGLTFPNPTVGCVIVKDGNIVGLGYHKEAGSPHAEIVALNQAGRSAENAEVFVTLEPCSHYGRTPPCADALIKAKVKKVIVATEDPNPLVRGKGIEKLRKAGVDVKVGILREEAEELNRDFFTYISLERPYITLKLAQTVDGRIATFTGDSKWITSYESRKYAHRLRSEANAILIGINTVLKDDPFLTIRYIPFPKNPLRVVIDPFLKIPLRAKLVKDKSAPTLVFFSKRKPLKEKKLTSEGIELVYMESIKLKTVLSELHKRGIVHLLVEGGAKTVSYFLREGLWDRFIVFQAPLLLGEGKGIDKLGIERVEKALKLKLKREIPLGEERVFEFVKE